MKQLLGMHLLIENEQQTEEVKTDAGVLIPITATKQKKGIVFKVGIGVNFEIKRIGGAPIKEGETVLYEPNEYPTITVEEKTYDKVSLDALTCVL